MKSLSRMKALHKRNTGKHILKFQNVWQNRRLQNAQVENVYTNNKYSSHKCALAFSNILNTWTHMSYWCPPLFPHTFVNYKLIEGMIHILLISVSNLQKSTQAFFKNNFTCAYKGTGRIQGNEQQHRKYRASFKSRLGNTVNSKYICTILITTKEYKVNNIDVVSV